MTKKHRDAHTLESRRLEAIKLFKMGEKQSVISSRLFVSRQAVSAWVKKFKKRGKGALIASKATGGPQKVRFSIISTKLNEILKKGARHFGYESDLWTTTLVKEVINKITGVTYHQGHVWKLLRKAGYTCQKPERRAFERNERAICRWRT